LMGLGVRAALTGDGVPAAPVTWCAEASFAPDHIPMLLWRAVGADGSDAGSDMMSVMTVGEPPRLVVARDTETNLVEHEKGNPVVWTATLHGHGRTDIDGYFTARPKPDALAELMAGLFTGKRQPLAAYSDDGKSVTIVTPKE